MPKLIIGLDTYKWLKYCTGRVLLEPDQFTVMIVYKDNRPIFNCGRLCAPAVQEQRIHDLYQLGIALDAKKVMNLLYDKNNLNEHKFKANIQLNILIGGVKEIYCEYDERIIDCLLKFVETGQIKLHLFGDIYNKETFTLTESQTVCLDDETLDKKHMLQQHIVGNHELSELDLNQNEEKFWEIGEQK